MAGLTNNPLMYNLQNQKIYGDMVVPDKRSLSQRLSGYELATALSGNGMSGDASDYVDLGNMNVDASGHASDVGKLPWHPTFSNESLFASNNANPNIGLAAGGRWDDSVFYPSRWQMQQPRYIDMMRGYANSPNSGVDAVIPPMPYRRDLIK
jgi:hypothetical protein